MTQFCENDSSPPRKGPFAQKPQPARKICGPWHAFLTEWTQDTHHESASRRFLIPRARFGSPAAMKRRGAARPGQMGRRGNARAATKAGKADVPPLHVATKPWRRSCPSSRARPAEGQTRRPLSDASTVGASGPFARLALGLAVARIVRMRQSPERQRASKQQGV